jgi:hypothetical protein
MIIAMPRKVVGDLQKASSVFYQLTNKTVFSYARIPVLSVPLTSIAVSFHPPSLSRPLSLSYPRSCAKTQATPSSTSILRANPQTQPSHTPNIHSESIPRLQLQQSRPGRPSPKFHRSLCFGAKVLSLLRLKREYSSAVNPSTITVPSCQF